MSGARPDTWMPLYCGDYLRDTMHLRAEGHGAYLLLIMAYWTSGQPLPDDDDRLSCIARLDEKAWRRLRPTLQEMFKVGSGVWQHGRIDEELDKAKRNMAARQEAGKKGGKAKANGKQNPGNATDLSLANGKQNPTPSPSPSPTKPANAVLVSAADAPGDPPRGKTDRKTKLPEGWVLPDEWREYAIREYPMFNVDREAERFHDRQLANNGKYVDWFAAWRNWLKGAEDYGRNKRANNVSDLEIYREVARQSS